MVLERYRLSELPRRGRRAGAASSRATPSCRAAARGAGSSDEEIRAAVSRPDRAGRQARGGRSPAQRAAARRWLGRRSSPRRPRSSRSSLVLLTVAASPADRAGRRARGSDQGLARRSRVYRRTAAGSERSPTATSRARRSAASRLRAGRACLRRDPLDRRPRQRHAAPAAEAASARRAAPARRHRPARSGLRARRRAGMGALLFRDRGAPFAIAPILEAARRAAANRRHAAGALPCRAGSSSRHSRFRKRQTMRPALVALLCALRAAGLRRRRPRRPPRRCSASPRHRRELRRRRSAAAAYAVSDAERFARVLVDLGGVAPANEIVLRQPKLRELLDALDLLDARASRAARGAAAAAAPK